MVVVYPLGIKANFSSVLYTAIHNFFFSIPVTGETNNSFPSTFSVTYQCYVSPPSEGRFIPTPDPYGGKLAPVFVQLLDGTYRYPETVNFTFAMKESPKDEYIVKFILTFDDFYEEVTLPATVSNGRVYIDSTPTTFVVNPNSLIDGNTIQLFQTENLSCSGTVQNDAKVPKISNSLDDLIASKLVQVSYKQTNSSIPIIEQYSYWFYDQKTGVLVRPTVRFIDVLLNKVGVACISNGNFALLDYSENLDFTSEYMPSLVQPPSSQPTSFSWWMVLIPIFIILFTLIVFFAYRASSLKKKKGEKRKTYSNKPLKLYLTRYNVRCSHDL